MSDFDSGSFGDYEAPNGVHGQVWAGRGGAPEPTPPQPTQAYYPGQQAQAYYPGPGQQALVAKKPLYTKWWFWLLIVLLVPLVLFVALVAFLVVAA